MATELGILGSLKIMRSHLCVGTYIIYNDSCCSGCAGLYLIGQVHAVIRVPSIIVTWNMAVIVPGGDKQTRHTLPEHQEDQKAPRMAAPD